jgi:hypothetical protein
LEEKFSILKDINKDNLLSTVSPKHQLFRLSIVSPTRIPCILSIPNFKNFLSLHIFVQSLAEQKHALKIPEHTLIIMCNNKLQATIDIQKRQNEHTLHSTQGNLGAEDKL